MHAPRSGRPHLDPLQAAVEPRDYSETLRLAPRIEALDPALRLPLVELAVVALRTMSPAQYRTFSREIDVLIARHFNLQTGRIRRNGYLVLLFTQDAIVIAGRRDDKTRRRGSGDRQSGVDSLSVQIFDCCGRRRLT